MLQQVIVSSIDSLFVGFRTDSSDDKVLFDKVIISNIVHQYGTDLESYVFYIHKGLFGLFGGWTLLCAQNISYDNSSRLGRTDIGSGHIWLELFGPKI